MPQSLSKIYLHIIFHVKTGWRIHEEHYEKLYAYLSGILKRNGSTTIKIGGTSNHVHMLCTLSRTMTVSDLIRETKTASSHWLNEDQGYRTFKWQGGYAAFSVSQSQLDKTKDYIENQEEHHRKQTWQEEYKTFLRLYNISFDERLLFDENSD